MTPAEAQVLLSMAAAYDNRKPDPDAAKAWAAALDGLRFNDCRTALIEHYKTSTDWLMPVMVRRIVKRIRRDRVAAFGVLPDPPPGLDADNAAAYQRWLADVTRSIADGNPPEKPAAIAATVGAAALAIGPAPGELSPLEANLEVLRKRLRANRAE